MQNIATSVTIGPDNQFVIICLAWAAFAVYCYFFKVGGK